MIKNGLQQSSDLKKMTTIQTYAIMFLVELGCGHGLRATCYLRLAVENLLAKPSSEDLSDEEELATKGILALHTYV